MKTIGLIGGLTWLSTVDFYKQKLSENGVETITPDDRQIEYINEAIFNEMHKGRFGDEMKNKFLAIINDLVQKGAQGIILGCTEIPMLIKQEDCSVPTFDTTEIHAKSAVEFSL